MADTLDIMGFELLPGREKCERDLLNNGLKVGKTLLIWRKAGQLEIFHLNHFGCRSTWVRPQPTHGQTSRVVAQPVSE